MYGQNFGESLSLCQVVACFLTLPPVRTDSKGPRPVQPVPEGLSLPGRFAIGEPASVELHSFLTFVIRSLYLVQPPALMMLLPLSIPPYAEPSFFLALR